MIKKPVFSTFLALLSLSALSLYAQERVVGPITEVDISKLPEDVRAIRASQVQLAVEENAVIEIIEAPGRSRTNIRSVPRSLTNKRIFTDSDANELAHNLYPYYGFSGTESLQLEHASDDLAYPVYRFRQYIDGIWTPATIVITTNGDGEVLLISGGGAFIDRDYPRTPQLDEDAAVAGALTLAEEKNRENVALYSGLIYRLDGSDIHTKIEQYVPRGEDGILEPVWTVYIPLLAPTDPGFTHQSFRVNPDGVAVDIQRDFEAARVCDGSTPPESELPPGKE